MSYRHVAARAGALILSIGGVLFFLSLPQSAGTVSFLIDHPLAFFALWMMLAGAYIMVRVHLDERASGPDDDAAPPREAGDADLQIGAPLLRLCVGDDLADEFLTAGGRYSLRRIIEDVRSERALELGIVVPKVQLQRDAALAADTYTFEIYGEIVARGAVTLPPDNGPAPWGAVRLRGRAAGATGSAPDEIFAELLGTLFTMHAAKLMTRPHFEYLVEHHLRGQLQSMVDWVGTTVLPYSLCHSVYQRLLAERVWPRYPVELFTRFIALSKTELSFSEGREHSASDVDVLYTAARKIIVPRELARRKVDTAAFRTLPDAVRMQILRAWNPALQSFSDIPVALPADTVPAAIVVPPHERDIIALFFKKHPARVEVYAFDELPTHASRNLPVAAIQNAADPVENARLSKFFA